jgi:hypothetical protein
MWYLFGSTPGCNKHHHHVGNLIELTYYYLLCVLSLKRIGPVSKRLAKSSFDQQEGGCACRYALLDLLFDDFA